MAPTPTTAGESPDGSHREQSRNLSPAAATPFVHAAVGLPLRPTLILNGRAIPATVTFVGEANLPHPEQNAASHAPDALGLAGSVDVSFHSIVDSAEVLQHHVAQR